MGTTNRLARHRVICTSSHNKHTTLLFFGLLILLSFFFIRQAAIEESVTGGIRLFHRPIRIVLIFLILVVFPINIALEVIEQTFEQDESLAQITDGGHGFAVCRNRYPVGHTRNSVGHILTHIFDIVVAKIKKLKFIDD